MTVEWSDPPRLGGSQRSELSLFVDELMKHPGKWGKYPKPIKHAANLQHHKVRHPDLKLVTRTVDGKLYAWGCYTPKRK